MLSKHWSHSKWKNKDFQRLSRDEKSGTGLIYQSLGHPTEHTPRKAEPATEANSHQPQAPRLTLGQEHLMRLS